MDEAKFGHQPQSSHRWEILESYFSAIEGCTTEGCVLGGCAIGRCSLGGCLISGRAIE